MAQDSAITCVDISFLHQIEMTGRTRENDLGTTFAECLAANGRARVGIPATSRHRKKRHRNNSQFFTYILDSTEYTRKKSTRSNTQIQKSIHIKDIKHHIAVIESSRHVTGGIQDYQRRTSTFMSEPPIPRSYALRANPDISLPGPAPEVGPPADCGAGPPPTGSRLKGRNHALGW